MATEADILKNLTAAVIEIRELLYVAGRVALAILQDLVDAPWTKETNRATDEAENNPIEAEADVSTGSNTDTTVNEGQSTTGSSPSSTDQRKTEESDTNSTDQQSTNDQQSSDGNKIVPAPAENAQTQNDDGYETLDSLDLNKK